MILREMTAVDKAKNEIYSDSQQNYSREWQNQIKWQCQKGKIKLCPRNDDIVEDKAEHKSW